LTARFGTAAVSVRTGACAPRSARRSRRRFLPTAED
jgi:hypothetical protein